MARILRISKLDEPSNTKLESNQPRVDEDHFSVLDDAILDSQTPEMSPAIHQRRNSFADGATVFSPPGGAWSVYDYGQRPLPTSQNTAPVYHDQRNNAYSTNDANTQSTSFSSQAEWPLSGPSGSCTPTPGYEGFVPVFENARAVVYSHGEIHAANAAAYEHRPGPAASVFPPTSTFSTSPQSAKDWMSASSSEQHSDFPSMVQQAHPQSPSFLGASQLLRRDGIRKKNARFEIPAERNLRTIDHMINQTNDEHEIKELKQQKRLLRNRQAALDSRQRKKQHTERLEEEKKQYTNIIGELEEALSEMKLQEAEWMREKETWIASQQRYKQYIDTMLLEKEELVRRHTIESGELRKKNSILMEQLQRMESTAMSTAPSSTGFSADFSDFDHLTMNSSPWDNFSVANEFSIETEPIIETSMVVASSSSSPPAKPERSIIKDDEKTATSGFLLMLLLCGAWVASRGTPSASSVDWLPNMPEHMRAASATVLDHIYEDAGIHRHQEPRSSRHSLQMPRSNALPGNNNACQTTLSSFELASLSNAPLERLHHQLTTPNEGQLRDQAFSLTPSQYNDLSSDGATRPPGNVEVNDGRTLGEAFSAIRSASRVTAAETYTRSLLLERIPNDIVRDFARMVGECGVGQQGPYKPEPMN